MTTANNDVFIFLLVSIDFWWKATKICLEGVNEKMFLLLVGLFHPPVVKTLYKLFQQVFVYNEAAPCTSHTSCTKVAILLLKDLSTLCVADICGIYFHLSVHSFYCNKFITSWTHLISPDDERSISH